MYNIWPGCYSFNDQTKMFLTWLKDQIDSLIFKVHEIDRILNS